MEPTWQRQSPIQEEMDDQASRETIEPYGLHSLRKKCDLPQICDVLSTQLPLGNIVGVFERHKLLMV